MRFTCLICSSFLTICGRFWNRGFVLVVVVHLGVSVCFYWRVGFQLFRLSFLGVGLIYYFVGVAFCLILVIWCLLSLVQCCNNLVRVFWWIAVLLGI